ncbi:MAG: hypothetical protein Q8K54_05735, partial [Gallionella sp.]|nr:hypothetical protein [Gallionella sp.]
PQGWILVAMLLHHADSALANFGGIFVWFVHGSILSRFGASSKYGAIQTFYTTHLSSKPPLAWVQVPMYAYIGGIQGGSTRITWQEIAEVINAGKCYLRVEDLPQR